MDRIKIETTDHLRSFEIPWEWVSKDGIKPKVNDTEAQAERGTMSGYLYRKRQAEIPEQSLSFTKSLYRYQIKDLLKLIREEKLLVTYFEDYVDEFITDEFYIPKPDLTRRELPADNNTDNILYAPFDLTFIAYGGLKK